MNSPKDNKGEEQSFWKAMQQDLPPEERKPATRHTELSSDLSEISPEKREQRRRSLLSMLAASEARQQQVLRKRLPALTPGVIVVIKTGEFQHARGTVMDADYIHGRALLQIPGEDEAQWIEFTQLAPPDDSDAGSETPDS